MKGSLQRIYLQDGEKCSPVGTMTVGVFSTRSSSWTLANHLCKDLQIERLKLTVKIKFKNVKEFTAPAPFLPLSSSSIAPNLPALKIMSQLCFKKEVVKKYLSLLSHYRHGIDECVSLTTGH